ncbi:MAG: adenylyltransferase/cytidyltransferase family protein [Patescibacteria group bacterium]
MGKILNLQKAINTAKILNLEEKSIVLAGGCFDILHIGHIRFLAKAKKKGDYLFILLESDQSVRKLKGKNRPINQIFDRAQILAAINSIDYIIPLEKVLESKDYDNIVEKIRPNIIAVTKNDKALIHKQRQAKKINAKVVSVIDRFEDKSTTRLAEIISKDF